MTKFQRRRRIAPPHAGRADHANLAAAVIPRRQFRRQFAGPGELARQAVADPDGERRRHLLAFLYHIEMGVEGRDFPDFGLGEAHFLGQSPQMGGGEAAVFVLNQMQKLDQQVAASGPLAQKCANLRQRPVFILAPLGRLAALPPAGFPDSGAVFSVCIQ